MRARCCARRANGWARVDALSSNGEPSGRSSDGHQKRTEWSVVYAALLVAAVVLFVWTVRDVLSPFVAYLALLALLAPFAGTRRHMVVVTVATSMLGLHVLSTLGGLLAPFFLAFALAYILDPAVDVLERRIRRPFAITILLVPALAIVGVLLVIGVPEIADQVENLIGRLPEAASRASTYMESARGWLGRVRIPFLPEFDPAALLNPERITLWLQDRQSRLMDGGLAALFGVGRGVGAVLGLLGYIVLTPVLTVYLLRDFDNIKERAAHLIPIAWRTSWLDFLREYDRLLSRFLRGQLIEATLVGVLTWLGLLVLGFPYSGLVGAIAGTFNLVPYLGLLASIVPVIVIALISGSVAGSLLKAGIVFAIVQFIDGSITGPRIVGESVGLHPIWVMLALAIGGSVFGFVGLLLAMPAAVLVKLMISAALEKYRGSRFFQAGATQGDSA
jgi:predicted PurR-regulated permease PerM